jgi:hypothetical protein
VILILLLVDLSVLAVDAAFTAQVLVSWAETGRGGGGHSSAFPSPSSVEQSDSGEPPDSL